MYIRLYSLLIVAMLAGGVAPGCDDPADGDADGDGDSDGDGDGDGDSDGDGDGDGDSDGDGDGDGDSDGDGDGDGDGDSDGDSDGDADSDADADRDCFEPFPTPTERLGPTPGELFYLQIGLGGWSTGESAIVVGPDGTIAIIDVGNDSHDDDIRDLLSDLVDHMNAHGGYASAPFSETRVDHIVITHFHADHADGLEDLLSHVELTGVLIHRGFVDITDAATAGAITRVCEESAERLSSEVALCEGAEVAPCDEASWTGTYPSTGCSGLNLGDLEIAGDSGSAFVSLGDDARMEILGADGVMAGDRYEDIVGPMHHDDSNGENARSIVALLRHGAFRILIAGDLTGGPSDTDPVESFFAERIGLVSDIDALGVDVLHAGHHGRNTSSTLPWVDRLLPIDGRSRNAVMGVSLASATSPHREALEHLLDGGRLHEGRGWTTLIGALGDSHPLLNTAEGGHVIFATTDGGNAYQVQTVRQNGETLDSAGYYSVRACP